jgi:hypothetical protein
MRFTTELKHSLVFAAVNQRFMKLRAVTAFAFSAAASTMSAGANHSPRSPGLATPESPRYSGLRVKAAASIAPDTLPC